MRIGGGHNAADAKPRHANLTAAAASYGVRANGMLDRTLIRWLRPFLERGARPLHAWGLHADSITWLGFALGVGAAAAVAGEAYTAGLALMLASRLCDGLDGALARLTQPTDRGAFLDIALDFLFYASIPLAFAIASPGERALPAATLLAAFIGTGSSFLAFAVFAARRGLTSDAYPRKGLVLPRWSHRGERNADLLRADVSVAAALCAVGVWLCADVRNDDRHPADRRLACLW